MKRAMAIMAVGLAAAGSLWSGPPGGDLAKQRLKFHVEVPPAPPLSPREALKTFRLPAGYRLELVASEPLIEAPVALAFDADGRMYVVEMRSYMLDTLGSGENQPTGRVSVLEDTTGDGRFDRHTVFLDGLVMPRAVAVAGDGVLVAEPPNLWFCRDTTGDGRADEKVAVLTNYGRRGNPEHQANGLVWSIDNWLYNANRGERLRLLNGRWQIEPFPSGGQWGVSFDDVGRRFYNYNSSQLHCDQIHGSYAARNPFYQLGRGASIADTQRIFPARVTPGVNRAYNTLRPDGTIERFTAVCGPLIYRGDALPAELYGDAFVCEPSANLIKRNRIVLTPTGVAARSAHGDTDFLASTDERFRPVNLYTAPDGTMYICDMYRGIIQHKVFLSAYLQDYSRRHGLDQHNNRGRIWRLVHESRPPGPTPRLSRAGSDQLVRHLSHPNGWWRDTAQRLLVERNDPAATGPLRKLAADPRAPEHGALHALWALHGLNQIDADTLRRALDSRDPRVRAAAVRMCEPFFRGEHAEELVTAIIALTRDEDPQVRAQLVLSLTLAPGAEPRHAVLELLARDNDNPLMRDALMTGVGGRELEWMEAVLADRRFAGSSRGGVNLLAGLAGGIAGGRRADQIERLLQLLARKDPDDWRVAAALSGLARADKTSNGRVSARRPVSVPAKPAALESFTHSRHQTLRNHAVGALKFFTWPGKPGAPQPPRALTPAEQAQFERGRNLYGVACAHCHMPSGLGQDGLAPPLLDSDWVLGQPQRVAALVMHGLTGPIVVNNRTWDMDMPGVEGFSDEDLAALLTYIRREWGHEADPVEPRVVREVRQAHAGRVEPWTAAELQRVFR
jgi:mono/diheme cytochrome c family protein/glucose/arabinose dehydrogenase